MNWWDQDRTVCNEQKSEKCQKFMFTKQMQAWSNSEVQSGPTLNLFFSHPRSSFGRDQTQTSDLPFSEVLWPPVLPYHFTAPEGHVALPTMNPTYSKPTNRRLGDGPVVRSGTHNVWTQSSSMTSMQSSPRLPLDRCSHTHHLSTSKVSSRSSQWWILQ